MTGDREHSSPDSAAAERVERILGCADIWAREYPAALRPSIRAVAVRLAEMVADQRNYLAPLPEPQEGERTAMLVKIGEELRSPAITDELSQELQALDELELRTTGSWAVTEGAQNQWIETAVQYLETAGQALPKAERPEAYWADDVVAAIIAFARATVGVDELQARTEARYSGGVPRPQLPPAAGESGAPDSSQR